MKPEVLLYYPLIPSADLTEIKLALLLLLVMVVSGRRDVGAKDSQAHSHTGFTQNEQC